MKFPSSMSPAMTPANLQRTRLFSVAILSLVLGSSCMEVMAADATTPPPPPPAPSRAPLGAPPSNDATRAYSFRTSIGSDPECQQYAQESDNVFLSSTLSIEEKTKQLEQIKASAKAAGCLK